MLSLKTHNILDYVAGAALILLSGVVADIPAARNLFLVAGFGQIAYSLFTNYKYSIMKLIPLGAHMALDCVAGLAILAGPWMLGYRENLSGGQLGLHIGLAVALFGLVGFTNRKTDSTWGSVRREINQHRVKRNLETAGRH